jgi:hypothetical protein
MVIVFKSYYAFSLVTLMSKMLLSPLHTKEAEITLPFDKIVHEKPIFLPCEVLYNLFEI